MRAARGLRRWVAIAAVALGSAVTVVGVSAAPAQAASAVIDVSNGILTPDCSQHPAKVAVSVPSGTRSWTVNVILYWPDGESHGVETVEGTSSGTRTTRWTFCGGGSAPGDYQIRINGYWVDGADDIHNFALATESFHMRTARSRTRLSVSDRTPRVGQTITVRSRTVEERPNGRWRPIDYGYVRLQRRGGGTWHNLPSSKFVNDKGVVTWRLRWRRSQRVTLRAFAHELQHLRTSTSRGVTIRVRGR